MVDKIDDEKLQYAAMTYVNGKIVASEALDKAILKNFSTCGSRELFLDED